MVGVVHGTQLNNPIQAGAGQFVPLGERLLDPLFQRRMTSILDLDPMRRAAGDRQNRGGADARRAKSEPAKVKSAVPIRQGSRLWRHWLCRLLWRHWFGRILDKSVEANKPLVVIFQKAAIVHDELGW